MNYPQNFLDALIHVQVHLRTPRYTQCCAFSSILIQNVENQCHISPKPQGKHTHTHKNNHKKACALWAIKSAFMHIFFARKKKNHISGQSKLFSLKAACCKKKIFLCWKKCVGANNDEMLFGERDQRGGPPIIALSGHTRDCLKKLLCADILLLKLPSNFDFAHSGEVYSRSLPMGTHTH